MNFTGDHNLRPGGGTNGSRTVLVLYRKLLSFKRIKISRSVRLPKGRTGLRSTDDEDNDDDDNDDDDASSENEHEEDYSKIKKQMTMKITNLYVPSNHGPGGIEPGPARGESIYNLESF